MRYPFVHRIAVAPPARILLRSSMPPQAASPDPLLLSVRRNPSPFQRRALVPDKLTYSSRGFLRPPLRTLPAPRAAARRRRISTRNNVLPRFLEIRPVVARSRLLQIGLQRVGQLLRGTKTVSKSVEMFLSWNEEAARPRKQCAQNRLPGRCAAPRPFL